MKSKREELTESLLVKNDYSQIKENLINIFQIPEKKNDQLKMFYSYFSSPNDLLNKLNVQKNIGIDTSNEEDINQRLKVFNSFTKINYHSYSYSYLHYLKNEITSAILINLIVGAFVGLIIGIIKDGIRLSLIDFIAVIISVLTIAIVSAFFNFRKDKNFNKLMFEISKKTVLVRRNGNIIPISQYDLMTGDILKIQPGDVIEVKGVLLSGHILCIQSQTNKIVDISKEDKGTIIINPTLVVNQGEGEMVVILVEDVDKGKKDIQSDANKEKDKNSELSKQIENLSNSIGQIGVIMGFIVGLTMLIKQIIYQIKNNSSLLSLDLFIVAVDAYIINEALKVVAIPEGLQMAGSVSMSYSVDQMIKDKTLINNIDKISTATKMNYLILNKSSVTLGNPKVKEAFINGKTFIPFASHNIDILIEPIIINTSNIISKFENRLISYGDELDNAMINFVIDNSDEKVIEENVLNRLKEIKENLILQIPFNSAYNYMLSIIKQPNFSSSKNLVYIKGFSDSILQMCSYYYDGQNIKKEIDDSIINLIHDYNQKCYTVIIVAQKETNSEELDNDFYCDFTILGILGIEDEINSNLSDYIRKFTSCGIEIKMVSNENIRVALKTCQKLGLISSSDVNSTIKSNLNKSQTNDDNGIVNLHPVKGENHIAMNGDDFILAIGGYSKVPENQNKSQNDIPSSSANSSSAFIIQRMEYSMKNINKFNSVISKLKLISNTTSEHKQVLLSGIKELNHSKNVVGITYSGIYDNDNLYIQYADISFSSNTAGKNIHNDKGDIILLSHSLSAILSSISHSRNIYDSIRKFLQYQLTICIVTVLFTCFGNFYFLDSPISPVQLLWINLIMDSFGALALATDRPDNSLLLYKPYSGTLFNKTMIITISSQCIFQLFTLTLFLYYGNIILGVPCDRMVHPHEWNEVGGYGQQMTFIFNMIIFMQVFNLFNCRKVHCNELNVFKGVLLNYLFWVVVIIDVGVQYMIINYGGRAMRTQPLSLKMHCLSVGISAISLIVNLLSKLFISDDEINLPDNNSDSFLKVKPKELDSK